MNALNMGDWIHPYHWGTEKFEAFKKMNPDKEFDLIAPVAIYFAADSRFKERAAKAWRRLKMLGHPVAQDLNAKEMLQERLPVDGIVERYKALFMFLCEQEIPEAKFTQDRYGALCVSLGKVSWDGDADGDFPWCATTKSLKDRLKMLEEDAAAS